MDCIFCEIASKHIPSKIVCEDDSSLAFLDINPIAAGHTVIIPKTHAITLLDLPDTEIDPLFKMVKKATARLAEILQPDGFTTGINHGQASGQSVPHLHVHVIPRLRIDGGGSLHSIVRGKPQESVEDVYRRLTAKN